MPFDPDAYLASKQQQSGKQLSGGFDPDAYLASKTPQSTASQAIGLLGSGISKGLRAVDSVTGAPTRAAISAAQNADTPSDIIPSAYKAFKGQFADTEKEAPTGEQIVEKAGVPHGMASKALGFGMDVAANPLNLAGPAARLAGKGAEMAAPIVEGVSQFANEKALKAAGAMTKDFRMIQDKGIQDSLGSFLLDNKIVTPLSTVSKVADRLSEAKRTAGQTIGHILDTSEAASAPKISARDIALQLTEDPEILSLSKVPGKEGTSKQINNYINTLYQNGDNLSLREAQALRQGIDESINFNRRVPEMAGAQPYLYKMRDAISKKMNESVNALSGGEEIDKLKEANLAYSKLATLQKIADHRAGQLSSNRGISLTDTIAGAGGMALGHSPVGMATGAAGLAIANKAGRTFGNPMLASGANAAANALKEAPGLLESVPGPIGLLPSVQQPLAKEAGLKGKKK